MLCSRTASFRATATMARFLPRLPPLAASLRPQRRSAESGPKRPRIYCADCTSRAAQVVVAQSWRSCAGDRNAPDWLCRGPEDQKCSRLAIRPPAPRDCLGSGHSRRPPVAPLPAWFSECEISGYFLVQLFDLLIHHAIDLSRELADLLPAAVCRLLSVPAAPPHGTFCANAP